MKLSTLTQDTMASIVVFLVALPLCMGIAIASGAPPAMGLLSGIVGGLVVGTFAGSPLQVSGPAAGLAVIVYEAIQSYGFKTFAIIVLIAGILQIIAGLFKLGQWFRAVAPAVIYAMLAGIGVLIIISQTHVMLDFAPQSSSTGNISAMASSFSGALFPEEGASHSYAAIIAFTTLSILFLWNKFRSRLPAKLATIPAPLLAILVTTFIAGVFQFPIVYVAVPESLGALVQIPSFEDFTALLNPSVWGTAIALAAVASAEGLLCAAALDKMLKGEPSDLDKELVAQGLGNTVLGFLGGLPLTGVIVRSSANVEAGGVTRTSAILHGAWLLLMVAFLPWVLQLIPVSALAAVLVYIGFKLVNVDAIKELVPRGRGEVFVYGLTLISIVFLNLLTGLIIGLVCSTVRLAWKASRLEIVKEDESSTFDVTLRGAATVFVLNKLVTEMNSVETNKNVRLQLNGLSYVDHACYMFIEDWVERFESHGGVVDVEWAALQKRNKELYILDKAS